MSSRGLDWRTTSVFATILLTASLLQAEENESGFRSLFDGQSLNNWQGNADTFRVEENAIVAGGLTAPIPRNEFLCTQVEFSDFELRLQAKLIGQGKNAGIQFRSRRVPNHHEMIGYQCDMGVMQNRLIWGWLYDESRRRKFLAEAKDEKLQAAFHEGQWNAIVIRCQGPRIQIWVNDLQTVDYIEQDPDIERSGLIGLQIHSGPAAEAWYRDIRIRDLKD